MSDIREGILNLRGHSALDITTAIIVLSGNVGIGP